MRTIIWLTLLCFAGISQTQLGQAEENAASNSDRPLRVLVPRYEQGKASTVSSRQGLWFMGEDKPAKSELPLPVNANDAQKEAQPQLGSKKRYTIGEARARLESAREQLARDKAIVRKNAENADPNKLELWRSYIAAKEKIIVEKELALKKIEHSYLQRAKNQRDSRLYQKQTSFYDETYSGDLSFEN